MHIFCTFFSDLSRYFLSYSFSIGYYNFKKYIFIWNVQNNVPFPLCYKIFRNLHSFLKNRLKQRKIYPEKQILVSAQCKSDLDPLTMSLFQKLLRGFLLEPQVDSKLTSYIPPQLQVHIVDFSSWFFYTESFFLPLLHVEFLTYIIT